MPNLSPPMLKKKTPLTKEMREEVFSMWGRKCYYHSCRYRITKKNYLCIHDITYTGQHTNPAHMRPLCRNHHNRSTGKARHARALIQKLREQGIKIGTTQDFLIDEDFYGGPKRN